MSVVLLEDGGRITLESGAGLVLLEISTLLFWPYPVVLSVFSSLYRIYLYPPPLPKQTPSVNLAFDISSILGIKNPIVLMSSQGDPAPSTITSPISGLLQAILVRMSVLNQYPKLSIYIQTALGDRYSVIFSPPL
jgi:hypothetical protein